MLSERERALHAWAAQGLAQTCWLTYADSAAGLGPDEMAVESGGRRWLEAVEEWEDEGRPGGRPPGVRDVLGATGGGKDYRATKTAYLLRPEVSAVVRFGLWGVRGC